MGNDSKQWVDWDRPQSGPHLVEVAVLDDELGCVVAVRDEAGEIVATGAAARDVEWVVKS